MKEKNFDEEYEDLRSVLNRGGWNNIRNT